MLDKFKNMGWKKFYLIYAMCTLGTMATRFLPFMIFNEKRTTLKYITYLGRVLPGAIFSMLIVYCLKNVNVTSYSYGLPELIAIIVTVFLHKWKKQDACFYRRRNDMLYAACAVGVHMIEMN